MKKAALLLLLSCLTTALVQAQVQMKPVTKKKVMLEPVQPAPGGTPPAPTGGTPARTTGTPPPPGSSVPPPPAPAKNSPPPPAPVSVYSLTGVSVRVRTGTDNKENLSRVLFNLYNTANDKICFQHASPVTTQFDVNSEMEFKLVRFNKYDVSSSLLLSSIQSKGITFEVTYQPNFFTDAWKVQGVTLVLEFKDQFGAPHPQYSNKVIQINNAVGFLDQGRQVMSCLIDPGFNVLNSRIIQHHNQPDL